MKIFTVIYKDNELNKMYRTHVRAADESRAIEVLKSSLHRDITVLSIGFDD